MSQTFRKRLFSCLIIVFFLLGASVILYAQGWRFDLSHWRLEKVGGIYIRPFPLNSQIYLDSKLVKESGLSLFRFGVFISDLLPRNYKLKIFSPGYKNWQETVAVNPSLVSQIENAVLVPQNAEQVSSSTINDFWLIGSGILVQNEKNQLIFDAQKIPGDKVVGWTDDSKYVFTEDNGQNYFRSDLSGQDVLNISSILRDQGFDLASPKEVLITDSSNDSVVIVHFPHSLWSFDLSTSRSYRLATSTLPISDLTTSPSYLAWSSFNSYQKSSAVSIYSKSSQLISVAPQTLSGMTVALKIIKDSEIAVLQDDGSLYVYQIGSAKIDKIASDAKGFFFTDDGNFLAVLENSAVEAFSFDGNNNYWRFRLPQVSEIKSLVWYRNNRYLFVQYPESTYFLWLNDSSLENFQKIEDTSLSAYDPQKDLFYFLKNGSLFSLEFPNFK